LNPCKNFHGEISRNKRVVGRNAIAIQKYELKNKYHKVNVEVIWEYVFMVKRTIKAFFTYLKMKKTLFLGPQS
jgi:hypothetical protein